MTSTERRPFLVVALVAAVLTLVGSVALVATATARRPAPGTTPVSMMQGNQTVARSPMMGAGTGAGMDQGMGQGMGQLWLPGDGVAVTSMSSARQRAAEAGSALGLHPGEVIWFDNGFYDELKDITGAAATEVMVDLVTGAVTTEPGPAMMWNTRYGMSRAVAETGDPAVSAEQAQQIADRWLADNAPGRIASTADAYPGYYTLETASRGQIDGMLSVNAITGAVWAHTWHGRFLAKEDR